MWRDVSSVFFIKCCTENSSFYYYLFSFVIMKPGKKVLSWSHACVINNVITHTQLTPKRAPCGTQVRYEQTRLHCCCSHTHTTHKKSHFHFYGTIYSNASIFFVYHTTALRFARYCFILWGCVNNSCTQAFPFSHSLPVYYWTERMKWHDIHFNTIISVHSAVYSCTLTKLHLNRATKLFLLSRVDLEQSCFQSARSPFQNVVQL